MKLWLQLYWKELAAVVALTSVASLMYFWNLGEIERGSDIIEAKNLCKEAGYIAGLDLDDGKVDAMKIGNTPKVDNRKIVVIWSDENIKVKCTVFRKQLDNFVVNGENLTGLVRREERK